MLQPDIALSNSLLTTLMYSNGQNLIPALVDDLNNFTRRWFSSLRFIRAYSLQHNSRF